jgi:hypothetical protein
MWVITISSYVVWVEICQKNTSGAVQCIALSDCQCKWHRPGLWQQLLHYVLASFGSQTKLV